MKDRATVILDFDRLTVEALPGGQQEAVRLYFKPGVPPPDPERVVNTTVYVPRMGAAWRCRTAAKSGQVNGQHTLVINGKRQDDAIEMPVVVGDKPYIYCTSNRALLGGKK